MAEYRIVAKIDPQTGAGSATVRQDLKGIQTEAKATETALNRSFDQAKFDRTIGGLVTRIEQLDKSLMGVTTTNSTLAKSNETLGQSLDRVALSSAKATTQTTSQGKATSDTASKQAGLEAALRRVLAATDSQAAEQNRANALLVDAKRLYDAGTISAETYAKAQQIASNAGKDLTTVTGSQRIGMQQLGFQLGDVATMYSLGAKPAQIFASQIGQVTQALQLMSDGSNRFLSVMAGPWGVAISVAAIVLAPLVAKLFEGNDALGDAIDKLQKDAKETEVNRQAKERYKTTIEGLTESIRANNEELRKSIQTQRDQLVTANSMARTQRGTVDQRIADAKRELDLAKEAVEVARITSSMPGADPVASALAARAADQRVAAATAKLAEAQKLVTAADEQIRRTQAAISANAAAVATDPVAAITEKYRQLAADAQEAYAKTGANDRARQQALTRELTLLEVKKKREIEIAQAAERAAQAAKNNPLGVGVSTFKSREQAIGIAGRELQSSGLKVGENNQFGGVKANHPGMGNDAHGRFAIDVNEGSGVVEANVPDLRAKFDGMARRYQARGYQVLWNGWFYEAGGSGPTRRLTGNQHRDHMHLQAPGTIVGKATGASTETQERREENAEAKVQARADDFVQGVINKAATRGLPEDTRARIGQQVDEAAAEYQRQFDRALPEKGKFSRESITKAFTDADARETAKRFEDAYVKPLERLEKLHGTVGLSREILNKQLDEAAKKGSPLTTQEEEQIAASVRGNDALTRKAAILESIKGPIAEYATQLSVLNDLLKTGEINQTSYNARIAEMRQAAGQAVAGVQGIDPGTGKFYEDVGKESDENARFAAQLASFQQHRQALLDLGVNYDRLVENATLQHNQNLAAIDQTRKDMQLGTAQEIFGSLTSIAEQTAGKQSGIYRAMFAIEKGIAIARSIIAIQTGIAQASALPFPANLGAIASVVAATASIVSNIRAVTLKDGGPVVGPGGPRSDSVPAQLSNGEFVINAQATADNRPLLEAINSGKSIRQKERLVGVAAAGGGPTVNVAPPPAPQVHFKSITIFDRAMMGDFLAGPEGEQIFQNWVTSNPELIQNTAQNG